VECAGFGTLTIDGLHEQLPKDGAAGTASTVYLHQGGTARVRDITSTEEKKKLIEKDPGTQAILK
jgi:hypothetical protein